MAPEQEALYALHWNVPRSELSMAAQFEYDRLRPAWERGETWPAAAELEAARRAWEVSRAYGAARPVTGGDIGDTTFLIVGGGHDVAQGRDGNAMTEDDTGWGDPPDPEIAQHGEQPQDGLAGQPRIGELEPDADGLPIQNRPATSRTYLIATACLAGGLVSVGLAVTEIAEYVKHNRVDNLAILGMVIGGLAGFTAAVVNDEKPPGWAGRINTVAVWLAVTGFSSLLFFYGGQHGWWTLSG